MPALDLTNILKEAPAGEWLALSRTLDRILATAKNLDAAIKAAKELGEDEPVVLKVAPVNSLVL